MEYIMINPFIYRVFMLYPLLIWIPFRVFSQSITGPAGAEQWMLAGNSCTVNNVWSANNNAAGITYLKTFGAGLYAEQRFNESHLQTTNLSIVAPAKHVHFAGSINYFGYAVFHQQRISLAVAKKLNPLFSLGVQLNYLTTFIQDYGSAGKPAMGLGLSVKPSPGLILGCVAFNPVKMVNEKNNPVQVPAYVRLGIAYTISEKLRFNCEADQQFNNSLICRIGMYYRIHEMLHLALGAATNPTYYSFGAALQFKKMRTDLAFSIHEVIGLTPHIALSLPVTQ